MSDPHRIETIEQLRERMGHASPATTAKVESQLDDFARDFIARSPFLILSTADAEGRQDASPKGDAPGFVAVADDSTLLIPDRKSLEHSRVALTGLRGIVGSGAAPD